MAGRTITPPLEPDQVHVWEVQSSPGRAAVRAILGTYLGKHASDVEIVNADGGKPQLAQGHRLRFNVSHSRGLTLVAVAFDRELGVDVERIDPRRATSRIARRFFARDELADLEQLPQRERIAGFYRCWTAKEAYVKALGAGLTKSLDGFVVSGATSAAPVLAADREERDAPARWKLARPSVPDGYAGCVASEGESFDLVQLSASA
ncbi:MAG: 4'-phosphopantetheinyl transferase superfamily protein [Solirubrobacterales bacterium]